MGQGLADQSEGPDEHEVEDVVEALDREVLDRADVLDAGVVDEDVDVRGQAREPVEVGEVGDHRLDPRGGVEPAQRVGVAVHGVDEGAGGGERLGHRGPDAARGAGDQGDPSGEVGGGGGDGVRHGSDPREHTPSP